MPGNSNRQRLDTSLHDDGSSLIFGNIFTEVMGFCLEYALAAKGNLITAHFQIHIIQTVRGSTSKKVKYAIVSIDTARFTYLSALLGTYTFIHPIRKIEIQVIAENQATMNTP